MVSSGLIWIYTHIIYVCTNIKIEVFYSFILSKKNKTKSNRIFKKLEKKLYFFAKKMPEKRKSRKQEIVCFLSKVY